jgi:hypothetical protein
MYMWRLACEAGMGDNFRREGNGGEEEEEEEEEERLGSDLPRFFQRKKRRRVGEGRGDSIYAVSKMGGCH